MCQNTKSSLKKKNAALFFNRVIVFAFFIIPGLRSLHSALKSIKSVMFRSCLLALIVSKAKIEFFLNCFKWNGPEGNPRSEVKTICW